VSVSQKPRQYVAVRSATVYKRLVRLVRSLGPSPGKRLPTQAELRGMLNASNDTLNSAMARLTAAGVVTRKTRVGTILVDPDKIPPETLTVGVATFPAPTHAPGAAFAELNLRIQGQLARQSCRCVPYYRLGRDVTPGIDGFAGLQQDIETWYLDGLISGISLSPAVWRLARRQGVETVQASLWETVEAGAEIDVQALIRDAVTMLHSRGCRQFAVVKTQPHDLTGRPYEALREALAKVELPANNGRWIGRGLSIHGGRAVAAELLEMPQQQRPDALIVLDDYIALGLTERLHGAADYRPSVVVQAFRELPMAYPLPVFRYEFEIERLARVAVGQLLDRVRCVKGEPVKRTAPVLADLEPAATPAWPLAE